MRRDLTRLLIAVVAVAALLGGYATFRIWEQGDRDERRQVDAIVVLGAAQYNGTPSPVFRARLEHAIALYRDGYAGVLFVTGGKAEGDRTTEAAAARQFAIENGVPATAILVEDEGRTTLESLRTVGAMLRERGTTSALFVSDRTHMLRVLRIARDEGLEAYGSPTSTSPSDAAAGRFESAAHELAALAVYFVAGDAPLEPPFAAQDDRPRPIFFRFSPWRRGIEHLYWRKPPHPSDPHRSAQPDPCPEPYPAIPSPGTSTRPDQPRRTAPQTKRGTREAGRGSVVRRSDCLRA